MYGSCVGCCYLWVVGLAAIIVIAVFNQCRGDGWVVLLKVVVVVVVVVVVGK